jgi:hypothetical protein
MAWILCKATLGCQARRIGDAARCSPLVALLVAASLGAGPFAAYLAARSIGNAMGDALADPRIARLLVLGLLLPAAAAGAAAAATAATPAALGAQIACAPLRRFPLAVAALAPVVLGGLAVAPLVCSLVLPIVSAGPAGVRGGLGTCLVLAAASAAGAEAAETLSGAVRGSRAHLVLALAVAGLAGAFVVLRFDPVAPIAAVVTSEERATVALVAAPLVACVLLVVWGVARGCRPLVPARRIGPGLPAPIRRTPLLGFGLAVLTRRADTRRALAAGVVFGGAGIVAGWLAGVRGIEAASAGLAPALAAAVIAPLAVGGAASDARWLLRSAPVRVGSVGLSLTAAAFICVGLVVATALVLSLAPSRIDADLLAVAAAATMLTTASAILAGTLAPWRSQGFADQLTAIVVLGAVAGALGALTVAASSLGERIGAGVIGSTGLPLIALGVAVAALDHGRGR